VENGKGRGSYPFKTLQEAVDASGDHGAFSDKDKAKGLALLRDGKPWSVDSSAGSFTISPPKGGGKKASGDGQSADDYWNGLEPKKPAIDEPALPPKTAKLMSRQENLLQKYMEAVARSGARAATDWDELPDAVREALRRVKDQETLWMDVNRWFSDNAPAQSSRWASGDGQSADDYWNNLEPKKPAIDEPALPPKTAAATVHFEGQPGFTLCGERIDSRTEVTTSPREATCYYCGIAWEKRNGPLPMYARVQMGIRTAAWNNLPKGWTQDSVQSMWDTMTDGVKHKVTKCMKEMDGKVDNTGAFCGSLADKVDPGWRGRDASTQKKDASVLCRAMVRVAHANPELRPVLLPHLAKRG